MTRVRVGVIGAGALGKHHARLYAASPQAELVGVYDANPATAREVAASHGVQPYAKLAELCQAVDAVSVAVPTDLHYQVVVEVLGLGRHVLVEKPLAASVEQGRQLVAQAEAADLILAVGHVERYNPVIGSLEQRLYNPRFIEAHRLAPYPPPRPGLLPRGTEVGVVLDLMIHDLDVILHLVKSPIANVDAVGVPILSPSEDIANARISFANGAVANVTASRVSAERLRKIRVFQPDGYLSLDYESKSGELYSLSPTGIAHESVPVEDRNALADELEDFLRCVQGRRQGERPAPQVSGLHGLRALELGSQISRQIAEKNERYGVHATAGLFAAYMGGQIKPPAPLPTS